MQKIKTSGRIALRWFLRATYSILFLLTFLFVFVLPSCLTFRKSPKKVAEYFEKEKIKPTLHTYQTPERVMSYAEIGNDSLPTIIFLHGSPGSWTAWIDFFKDSILLQKFRMVAPDRPGFGYSGYGDTEKSLQKQVELLKPILEKYQKVRPVILVGHSLGGPLIARIVMDYPSFADGLVFVAPSIDPEMEKVVWYQRLGHSIRGILPGSIRASNEEILPLKGELEKMLPRWKNIKQQTIFIHGTKDNLVPVENADFAKKMLTNAQTDYIIIDGLNHFIPWKRPELIRNGVLKILNDHKKEK